MFEMKYMNKGLTPYDDAEWPAFVKYFTNRSHGDVAVISNV